jgi:hypothetical protein
MGGGRPAVGFSVGFSVGLAGGARRFVADLSEWLTFQLCRVAGGPGPS